MDVLGNKCQNGHAVLAGHAFLSVRNCLLLNITLKIGEVEETLSINHHMFISKEWKIHEIFLLDAATYVAVIFIFILMKYTPLVNEKIHTEGLFERLKGGFMYLKSNPIIFVFGLASYMLFAFTLVEIHVVLPLYVKNFLKMDGNVFA